MIDKHLRAFQIKQPDIIIKAAFLGRDEGTGYVGFYYLEPAKILLVLDKNDTLYAMKFTAQHYYKSKMLSNISLKFCGKLEKNCFVWLKGADACFDPAFSNPDDPDSNPVKKVAFGITRKDKVLLDSKYRYEECFLGDTFESDRQLISHLEHTFSKNRAANRKAPWKGKQKPGSFDF